MTTDILLALALVAALILNAAQASTAQVWRNKIKELKYQIELLTRPIEDEEAVHLLEPGTTYVRYAATDEEGDDDWLAAHPGVTPKPGYERKRR